MSEKTKDPVPQGKYVPATRGGSLVFTAGMTPRKDGVLQFSGKVEAGKPFEKYREAARIAASMAARSSPVAFCTSFDMVYVHAFPFFSPVSRTVTTTSLTLARAEFTSSV